MVAVDPGGVTGGGVWGVKDAFSSPEKARIYQCDGTSIQNTGGKEM